MDLPYLAMEESVTFAAAKVKSKSAIGAVTFTGAGSGLLTSRKPLALACPAKEVNLSARLLPLQSIIIIMPESSAFSRAKAAAQL